MTPIDRAENSAKQSFRQRWLRRWTRASQSGVAPLFDLRQLGRNRRFRNEAIIRGLCSNAYLGGHEILCRTLGRYKMFVDARDAGLTPHLVIDGYWEMWLTEALAETIKPGMTVVDIGANLGYFTILMADLVGPDGAVHAFEPNPELVSKLARSVSINGFYDTVTLHEQALGDSEALVRLIVPENEPKNGYLAEWEEGAAELQLQTRRFDSYVELLAADVIKIDADTSELAIWRGLAGRLTNPRPLTIFLEFAAARYDDAGGFLDELIAHGFSLAELTLDDGILPTSKTAVLASVSTFDIMLVLRR